MCSDGGNGHFQCLCYFLLATSTTHTRLHTHTNRMLLNKCKDFVQMYYKYAIVPHHLTAAHYSRTAGRFQNPQKQIHTNTHKMMWELLTWTPPFPTESVGGGERISA